jgi:ribonuclease D
MQIAEKKDQPLFKIMSNQSLMAMAEEKPATIDQILKIRALSPRQSDMYGKLCVEVIMKAMELEQDKLPLYPKSRRPKRDMKVQERIKKLKKMREKSSSSMGMEPGFILNNAVISSIALTRPDTSENLLKIENIRRWQVETIGNDIISTLGYCNE